jgi:hypothetical protein
MLIGIQGQCDCSGLRPSFSAYRLNQRPEKARQSKIIIEIMFREFIQKKWDCLDLGLPL